MFKSQKFYLAAICILGSIVSCISNPEPFSVNDSGETIVSDTIFPTISIIKVESPVFLNEISLDSSQSKPILNQKIMWHLQHEVLNYYLKMDAEDYLFNDSKKLALQLAATYMGCLLVETNETRLYLLLLKHPVTSYCQSVAVFYSKTEESFIPKTFFFNLWINYDWQNDNLVVGDLSKRLEYQGPELELEDYNQDGILDFKFKRILHNGTYNALELNVLSVKEMGLDTLSSLELVIR